MFTHGMEFDPGGDIGALRARCAPACSGRAGMNLVL